MLNKKTQHIILGLLLGSAILIDCICAFTYWNLADIGPYNFNWARLSASHWLQLYQPHHDGSFLVNYPPLIPTLFWPIGKLINHFQLSLTTGSAVRISLSFLAIKFVGMAFQWATALFMYWKAKSKNWGLVFAALMLFSSVLTFNASFWGQLDSALSFFILVSFYYLKQERFRLASFWFALGCLTKLQFIYLIPIFGLTLLLHGKLKTTLQSVGIVIGINILGWLPFVIAMKRIILPFQVIIGGFIQYPKLCLNAFNVWAISLRTQTGTRTTSLIGPFKFGYLNEIIILVIVVGICLTFWWLRCQKQVIPLECIWAVYSGLIFMLTAGQHERYQISMLAFLILWLLTDDRPFNLEHKLVFYGVFSLMISLNQVFAYLSFDYKLDTKPIYLRAMQIGSSLNVLIFVGWLVYMIHYLRLNKTALLKDGEKNAATEKTIRI
jgi:Gpi18-like mannosyltransferase